MIKLQPISTSDLQHYKFMEELLVDAFPPEEYRQLEELREYTDRTGNFISVIRRDWGFLRKIRTRYNISIPPVTECAVILSLA